MLLHGGSFDNLLIDNLERDVINIESDIRCILQFSVEIEKTVVGVYAFQNELHTETLGADMLDFSLVLLVD